jgi:hypothetical protein
MASSLVSLKLKTVLEHWTCFVQLLTRLDSTLLFVQKILLLVGAMALGAILCGPGLFYLMAVTVWQPRGQEFIVVIPLFSCGAALAAFLAFVFALHWIATRGGEVWKPRIWFGGAAGLGVGLAIRVADTLPGYPPLTELFQFWPVTLLLMAALATLGGILAGIAGTAWDHRHSQE